MSFNFNSFFTFCFCWVFSCFLAVHFAYMKSPSQFREIASQQKTVQPWYDASFKL